MKQFYNDRNQLTLYGPEARRQQFDFLPIVYMYWWVCPKLWTKQCARHRNESCAKTKEIKTENFYSGSCGSGTTPCRYLPSILYRERACQQDNSPAQFARQHDYMISFGLDTESAQITILPLKSAELETWAVSPLIQIFTRHGEPRMTYEVLISRRARVWISTLIGVNVASSLLSPLEDFF